MASKNPHSTDNIASTDDSEYYELSQYRKSATAVINLKIIYNKDDLSKSTSVVTFKPEMAHQLFGDNEMIFGYRHLTINLNYLHNSSHCYLDIKASGKVENAKTPPDDIQEIMNTWLPTDYVVTEEAFLAKIDEEVHDHMFGEVIGSFKGDHEVILFPDEKVYPTYKITKNSVESEEFQNFHCRFETHIIWYIDGARYIEIDDNKWLIFYVYEEYEHPKTKKLYRTPIGFMTVYQFFSYPNNVRARISQFMILPPYQNRGIGRRFYSIVAKTLRDIPEVVDITAEEPISTFQRIRDIDECLMLHKQLQEIDMNFAKTDRTKLVDIMHTLKISKVRAKRIYDVLGMVYAKHKGLVDYNKFQNSIKRRIKHEIEREFQPSKRLCNTERLVASSLGTMSIETKVENECKAYVTDIELSVVRLAPLISVSN